MDKTLKNKYKFCPKCGSSKICVSMDCIITYYYENGKIDFKKQETLSITHTCLKCWWREP